MKKLLLSVYISLFFIQFTNAQFVEIPDTAFRSYLMNRFPTCFNAQAQMDTTCDSVRLITFIDCSYRNIESIDGVQYFKNLSILDCSHNGLTSFPYLNYYCATPSSAYYLNCSYNMLQSLPSFSHIKTMQAFSCNNNILTELCPLPSNFMANVSIEKNFIKCINNSFPSRVFWFSMDSSISCVPDRVYFSVQNASVYGETGISLLGWGARDNMGVPMPLEYSICSPANNKNDCLINNHYVYGNIFYDLNQNDIKDDNEPYAGNIELSTKYWGYGFSNENGAFKMGINGLSVTAPDTLSVVAPNYFIAAPSLLQIPYFRNDTTIHQNFALQPTVVKDSLSFSLASTTRARPGRTLDVYITYKNAGTTVQPATLDIIYDSSLLIFEKSSNVNITGRVGRLQLPSQNLNIGEKKKLILSFTVRTIASIGDSIKIAAKLQGTNTSVYDSVKIPVTNSFDPNDKQATEFITDKELANGAYIDYLIRFQNTGNDTAFKVVIEDSLSHLLDFGSIEIISSSHLCNVTTKKAYRMDGYNSPYYFDYNIVYFDFLDIMLPDSTTNEKESHGYVHFRAKPLKSLDVGKILSNKAYIYFDYNIPVVTNIVTTTIVPSSVAPVKLIDIYAKIEEGDKMIYHWTVQDELNIKSYAIETSIDGINFSNIGGVSASGLTSYTLLGKFESESVVLYYRLKVIDNIGKVTYSQIKSLRIDSNPQTMQIKSNPVRDFLEINLSNVSDRAIESMLLNSNSVVVKTIKLKQGTNSVDISSLPSGLYVLKNEFGIKRIVKL